MELRKNILISLALFTMMQCTSQVDSAQDKRNVEKSQLTSSTATLNEGEYYDYKMEQWFIAFNRFQQEGADMHTADTKAWEAADSACKLWLKQKEQHIASEQSRDNEETN